MLIIILLSLSFSRCENCFCAFSLLLIGTFLFDVFLFVSRYRKGIDPAPNDSNKILAIYLTRAFFQKVISSENERLIRFECDLIAKHAISCLLGIHLFVRLRLEFGPKMALSAFIANTTTVLSGSEYSK